MTETDSVSRTETMLHWLWVRFPMLICRFSLEVGGIAVDGFYLMAWRPVALFASPAALLAGFLLGWQHWGFREMYSESMAFLTFATVVGILSGRLGALFVAGFAVSDFFIAHPDWNAPAGILSNFLQMRVSLLVEYTLLGILTVSVPIASRGLVLSLPLPQRLSRLIRFLVALALHSLITYILVYGWAQTFPLLSRPPFWIGGNHTTSAIAPLQNGAGQLACIAGIASLARLYLQGRIASFPDKFPDFVRFEAQLRAAPIGAPLTRKFPVGGSILVASICGTVLLSGMVGSWSEEILLFAVLLCIRSARAHLLPVRLGRWPFWMENIPLLVRLAGGSYALYCLAQYWLDPVRNNASSFQPIFLLVVSSLLLFYLLNPGLPPQKGETVNTRESTEQEVTS